MVFKAYLNQYLTSNRPNRLIRRN